MPTENTEQPPANSRAIYEHLNKVDPAAVTDTLIVAFADQTGTEPVDFIRAAPGYVAALLSELRAEQSRNVQLTQRLQANIQTITEFNLALAEYCNQCGDPLFTQNMQLCIDQVKQRISANQPKGPGFQPPPSVLTVEEMEKVMNSPKG